MSATRVVVITGASSGIGRNSAIALSAAGWAVVLSGRRQAELEETAAKCGPESLVVCGDITKEEDVVALFRAGAEKFGMGAPAVPLEELTLEQWQAVVNVNLTAPFLCTREAIRYMKKTGGGRIINNGSISAHAPRPNSAAYTSTKHAISGLSKSTALDGRKYNIACTQIDIGQQAGDFFETSTSVLTLCIKTGNASTAMGSRMANGVMQANGKIEEEPVMDVSHVGDAVVYCAGLPPSVTILNMTILATNMPFVGRG
ncbi:hypothetical protein P7C70_g7338, partial [Phenoliferia sp. Uapishka_3]